MFDPNFDPLASLEKLNATTRHLIELHNQNTQLLRQAVEQINQQTDAINAHDLQINQLHNRVRLLEVARQYENTTKDIIDDSQALQHHQDSNAGG